MPPQPLNDLWHFDAGSSKWTAFTHVDTPPCPRSFHKMVFTGGAVYVFGGCAAAGRLADLHVGTLDTHSATVSWAACPNPPPACKGRGGAGFVHLADPAPAGSLVVLAGFAGEETKDMYVFDIATSAWSEVKLSGDAFTPRSVFAIVPVGPSSAMVFGGEVGESAKGHEGAGDFAADTLTVSLRGEVKSCQPEGTPPARGWAACDCHGKGMVLVGGLAGNDANPVRLADAWVGSL